MANMNTFAVAVAFALVAVFCSSVSADHDCMKKIDAFKDKCKSELKLSDDDVKGLDKEEPFSNGTKCLIKCIAENMEIFNNGTLVQPKILAMIDEFTKKMPADRKEKDLEIFKACKDTPVEACPCETASKIYSCVRENAKKLLMANMPNKKM